MTIHELLQAAGLTANDEIPIWDAEATGEPTKKITAQQLAAAVVALANLVTSVNSQTGAVSITPENIGAVALNGSTTMTGTFQTKSNIRFLSDGTPYIDYISADGSTHNAQILYMANGGSEDGRFKLREYRPNGNNFEDFNLPIPDASGNSIGYDILTSKSPVTIPQGGTGAKTAEQAARNITGCAWDTGTNNTTDTLILVLGPNNIVQHRKLLTWLNDINTVPVGHGGTGATTEIGACENINAVNSKTDAASRRIQSGSVNDAPLGMASYPGQNDAVTQKPYNSWFDVFTFKSAESNYARQVALPWLNNRSIAFRNQIGGTWGSWRYIATQTTEPTA